MPAILLSGCNRLRPDKPEFPIFDVYAVYVIFLKARYIKDKVFIETLRMSFYFMGVSQRPSKQIF